MILGLSGESLGQKSNLKSLEGVQSSLSVTVEAPQFLPQLPQLAQPSDESYRKDMFSCRDYELP